MRAITGRDLIRLLELDGWTIQRRANHGVFLSKRFREEPLHRSTVVPDKTDSLPKGTLGRILSSKQTGLGPAGLERLLDLHG